MTSVGLANALRELGGRRTPCPAWGTPEPGDHDSETYDQCRRRLLPRLRGEEEARAPAHSIAREFVLAMAKATEAGVSSEELDAAAETEGQCLSNETVQYRYLLLFCIPPLKTYAS